MAKCKNEVGNRYGKLIVVRLHSIHEKYGAYWECVCDCGGIKICFGSSLRRGALVKCDMCRTNSYYEHPDGYMVGVTAKGEEFFFDKEDLDKVRNYSWYVGGKGYIRTSLNPSTTPLHRFILGITSNDAINIDHVNRNKLDNRKCNLRMATYSENNYNRVKKGSSKYKGVYKQGDKWRCVITKDGKKTHIGYYTSEEEAAMAYNKKAVELFGEFAYLNVVLPYNKG